MPASCPALLVIPTGVPSDEGTHTEDNSALGEGPKTDVFVGEAVENSDDEIALNEANKIGEDHEALASEDISLGRLKGTSVSSDKFGTENTEEAEGDVVGAMKKGSLRNERRRGQMASESSYSDQMSIAVVAPPRCV